MPRPGLARPSSRELGLLEQMEALAEACRWLSDSALARRSRRMTKQRSGGPPPAGNSTRRRVPSRSAPRLLVGAGARPADRRHPVPMVPKAPLEPLARQAQRVPLVPKAYLEPMARMVPHALPGPQGPAGADGAQGLQGIQGLTGPAGFSWDGSAVHHVSFH
jgi:hypothetical protein